MMMTLGDAFLVSPHLTTARRDAAAAPKFSLRDRPPGAVPDRLYPFTVPDRDGEIVPLPSVEQPSVGLRRSAAPLLKEERYPSL